MHVALLEPPLYFRTWTSLAQVQLRLVALCTNFKAFTFYSTVENELN